MGFVISVRDLFLIAVAVVLIIMGIKRLMKYSGQTAHCISGNLAKRC
jgi:hypothetical protein